MLLIFVSCSKIELLDDSQTDSTTNLLPQDFIDIPEGFDYSTYRTVNIEIKDNSSNVTYDVFAYSEELVSLGQQTFENEFGEMETKEIFRNDIINKFLFSGVPNNGVLEQSFNLPKFCDAIYIRRNDNLKFSSEIVMISENEVTYDYNSKKGYENRVVVEDFLFCVNGSGELFQVNPLDGALTLLADMPMGSFTAAIDQDNKMLYSIGKSSPYPLMRYDIANDSWQTIANVGIGGPRLDFNSEDDLLYFSKSDKLYSINPSTGAILNQWDINGIHDTAGGDLAFADDGSLFLCSFSGLYKLELNGNNQYDSTRISADNLPFSPTSMTFDSDQDLWLANSASSSDLIIMDTSTGGFSYIFGVSANNGSDFGRTINDLTTFRVFTEVTDDPDTDGDGIPDRDDEYPNDPDKAFEIFTPSEYGTGTIAFEDLWPSNGDYDFNDVALNYQAIVILNSNNLAVQIDLICKVKSNSAGYTNGIGIEFEGLTSSDIQSVSGTVYSEGYINNNGNGTESNQSTAVVILTDNADNLISERTISIVLNDPTNTNILGAAPFDPFIIANKVRANEIHLPYHSPTSLGNNLLQIDGQNNDENGDYISNNGFPWVLSIIHDFKVPKESVRIYDAYNFFNDWATSGGTSYEDWYKDNPGNRNENLLKE